MNTPDDFPDRRLFRGFEGGAIYTAERDGTWHVIIDESALADFSAYLRMRGWN